MTRGASSAPAWIHVGATPDELHAGHGSTDGSVVHLLYRAAHVAVDPLMPHRVVVLHGLRRVDVVPTSAFARSVPVRGSLSGVSIPIAIEIPRALQSSCARSMFGLCPLRSDRNASCGRPASVAARFVLQPRCSSCASTKSASRRLTGPVGLLLIGVFTSVLGSAVRDWAWGRRCVPAPLCFRVAVEPVISSKPADLWISRDQDRLSGDGLTRDGGLSRSSGSSRRSRFRAVPPRRGALLLSSVPGFLRSPAAVDARRCTRAIQTPLLVPSCRLCSRAVVYACGLYSGLVGWQGHGKFLGDALSVCGAHPPRCDVRCTRVAEIAASALFLREQLAAIDRQRDALDLHRALLTEALEVLERDVSPVLPLAGPDPRPVPATPLEEPPTLAMRILGVLRKSGPLTRRQLLSAFEGTDVKAGTLDSAVYRLKARRLVDKCGARFAVVEPEPSDARSSGVADRAVEQGVVETRGDEANAVSGAEERAPSAVTSVGVPDADDPVPLTVRVHEAVATGVAGTRRDLLHHFAAHGVGASKVDSALSNLRRHRKLRSVGGGVIVVGSGASSGTAHAGSPGS